jgi:predicted RNA methylase
MKILNTTIQNRTKEHRLKSTHVVPYHLTDSSDLTDFLRNLRLLPYPKDQILYSIGVHLLSKRRNPAVDRFLNDYEFDVIQIPDIPRDVFDLLGSTYQYLNSKMENLKGGIFYTGKELAVRLTEDLSFDNGQVLFDPSCGSGSFLFRSAAPPTQLVGIDADPIGVMIAKFNYFLKFPNASDPKIFCSDFFDWAHQNTGTSFDYIIGNPPFGANLDLSRIKSNFINSGESFSYFIEYSYQMLAKNGRLRFIVPESLLNVKRHTDIRNFILEQTNLNRIVRFSKKFTGVMSDIYMIELDRRRSSHTIFEDNKKIKMDRQIFFGLKNQIFVPLSESDLQIINKVNELKAHDLSKSTFGLGVVTGNNSDLLRDSEHRGFEPIYTGKDVYKYRLESPSKFLRFKRELLQQVAPDEIYRAPSKLVYKTISKTLRFALDETGALTTNSANIVIPQIPGYNALTVMAFLNSDLYSFLYMKLFGGVNKIGKEHLMHLPFPKITASQRNKIDKLCRCAISRGSDDDLQTLIHKEVFELTDKEIEYLRDVVTSIR